jgi:tetratricopeptide (TPR) repeat protein
MLRDLDAAENTLERAIVANPNEPLAWLYRSVVHGFRGQGEEAWRTAATATSLSPLDPQRHYFDALACSAAVTSGRLTEGIEFARRALEVNRSHLPTLRALTVALAESGDVEAARDAGRQFLALAPDFTVRSYIETAPKGSEESRQRFGRAFSLAGLPTG